MDWLTIPSDVFADVSLWLEPREVVTLERVCKSWKDLLSEQVIWKAISVATHPNIVKHPNIVDWREYALRDLTVMKNMKSNRGIVRVLKSSYFHSYSTIMYRFNVANNEALVATVDYGAMTSYSFTNILNYKLLDLYTLKETKMEKLSKVPNVLLTKDYIVTAQGSPSVDHFDVENKIQIINRATNEVTKIERIGNRYKFGGNPRGVLNDNTDYNTFVIYHSQTNSFYVVDVEKCSWKEFKFEPLSSSRNLVNHYKLQGKYLAYSQLSNGYQNNGERLLVMEVIDTETGQTVFSDKSDQYADWDITEDKVVFAAHTADDLKWVMKSFAGEVISEYNSAQASENTYSVSLVRLFGNFIVQLHGNYMAFFDAFSSELLCKLFIHDPAEAGKLHLLGSGKFLYTNRNSTRIIDFESKSITKSVQVKVLHPDRNPQHHQVPFHKIFDFWCEQVFGLNLITAASVLVSQNDAQNERVSMIYTAYEGAQFSRSNEQATDLLPENTNVLNINMVPPKFDELSAKFKERVQNYRKVNRNVSGPALLYKEKLVNGQWVPVDYTD